ncbi:heparin lyase I family protein [Gellertiella hungarica]|uniref:Uncharacterized protein n=1 Tax=Gellertiella hungarica TaxID=1572859 RepID=A0A7W6J4M7_9HYPH|nr:heparin lyase I family protein [Gellertiella hungarica]MBB4064729.1 hypothetical protein [Gellertiella hungarica]
MAIILTQAQAFELRNWSWYTGDRSRIIEPRLMTDGRYAVPESLLNEPTLAPKRSVLIAGTIADLSSSDFVADTRAGIIVDGKTMFLQIDRVPWAFTVVAPNVHRFELRQGDQGGVEASPHRLHRCEIVAMDVPAKGTELWQAYSVMLEPGNPFSVNGQCYINQWHGYDSEVGYGRAPPLSFDYGNNQFRIWSRSDASIDPVTLWGTDVLQYSAASPARDVYTNFVINVKFASSGFLRVWMNGTQIVNYTGPIGYYNDTNGTYPQWGIYARQAPDTPVARIANMEWGTTDRSARISAPLSIPN